MASDNVADWLEQGPMEGLLETDIRSRSFNKAPWKEGEERRAPLPWKSSKLVLDNESPFEGMRISETKGLNAISDRTVCPKCNSSRKYFCYTCLIPLAETRHIIPNVEALPVRVDVIKHARENDGKSTALHAKVICPSHVRIFIYPDIPDYSEENVVVLFPGKKAKTFGQIKDEAKARPIDRVVFIDSTWNQTKRIYLDPRIACLPQVVIDDRETVFWRHQKGKSKQHLATIEAIYYFVCDFHKQVLQENYDGQYDNILFLYKFMYDRIHDLYKGCE